MPRIEVAHQLLRSGELGEAEKAVSHILRDHPDDVSALTLLGGIKFRIGDLDAAETCLQKASKLDPMRPDALGLLAVVNQSRNDFPQAIEFFEKLLALGVQSADLHNQIGRCWLELRDANRAGAAFKKAIELDRTAAHSYFNLGLALKLAGNSYETFYTFQRAAELDPNRVETYLEIWDQMGRLRNWKDGVSLLEEGWRRRPESVSLRVALASAYGKVGRAGEAEALFRTAVAEDPSALIPYAHWLQEEGRFADSVPLLEQSIRTSPLQGQAYYNLTSARVFSIHERPIPEVAGGFIDEPGLSAEERMFLYYALAKSHDHQKEYRLAMHYFDLANQSAYQLYNAGITHDARAVEDERRALKTLYTRRSIEEFQKHGSSIQTPIFIVGMIRTGTTLLDQILASHPEICSAGEQPFWEVIAGPLNYRWLESGPEPSELSGLSTRYLHLIEEAAGQARRITDKMPTNFYHLGLISMVFPKAKFVHIRRNPIDTCLSIYTTFLGTGTPFAYHQENIVEYYRVYLWLMEFWRSVLPDGQMIEIDYEDLVRDKEAVLRPLLEFLGLDWSDQVLKHHEQDGHVSTPSLWTARQPVSTSSVGRWKRYEPWLWRLKDLSDIGHPPPTLRIDR